MWLLAGSEKAGLMRGLSSHFSGHHPIERDSHETDGVLGTRIVRRETYENPEMTEGCERDTQFASTYLVRPSVRAEAKIGVMTLREE